MLHGIVILHEYGTNVLNIVNNENGCLGAKNEEEIVSGFLSTIISFFSRAIGKVVDLNTEFHKLDVERIGKWIIITIFQGYEQYKIANRTNKKRIYPSHYQAALLDIKWEVIKKFRKFSEITGDEDDPYRIDFIPLQIEMKKLLKSYESNAFPEEKQAETPQIVSTQ